LSLALFSIFAPMIVACIAYCGFAIFKPEKLQSEDYQIRHESLQIIQEKGGVVPIGSTSLEAIANPSANPIAIGGGE
jgi:hypothetical protein